MATEAFIGEVRMFGFNFPPRNWALCNGQILAIQTNQALFALLGTTYGGNGSTTFALPNLQSRIPVHYTSSFGSGLSNYVQGQASGSENVTLISTQMPTHTHTNTTTVAVPCQSGAGDNDNPTGAFPASGGSNNLYAASGNVDMKVINASPGLPIAGGNQPHDNMPPFLCVNFSICQFGVFPSRN
ncbi:MAG: phage tail protein [Akkermansiaceae bacterium]|nr:phage tail protein [Akkermansiaceae bacterium]